MARKLSAAQQRRVEEIRELEKVVDHVAKLVSELDQSRAATALVLEHVCETVAREMSQMRQRALTANIGTIADVAGYMSVMAGRGGGIDIKIRGLRDGGKRYFSPLLPFPSNT